MSFVPVAILRYRCVMSDPPDELLSENVTPRELEAHLSLVTAARATPISLLEFASAVRSDAALPTRPVVFTFEQPRFTVANALPLFAEYDFPSTYFVTPAEADELAERLQKVEQLGGEIGTMLERDDDVTGDTVVGQKTHLEAALEHLVEVGALGPGLGGPRLRRHLELAGYRAACSTNEAISSNHDDLFALSRLSVCATTKLSRIEAWLAGEGAPVAPGAAAAARSVASRFSRHHGGASGRSA